MTRRGLERAIYRGMLAALRAHGGDASLSREVLNAAARAGAEAVKGPPSPEREVVEDVLRLGGALLPDEVAQDGLADAVAERLPVELWPTMPQPLLGCRCALQPLQPVPEAEAPPEPAPAPEVEVEVEVEPQPDPTPATKPHDAARAAVRARKAARGITWQQAADEMELPLPSLMNWLSGAPSRRMPPIATRWAERPLPAPQEAPPEQAPEPDVVVAPDTVDPVPAPEPVCAPEPVQRASPTPGSITPPEPFDPNDLEPVPCSLEGARDWLYAQLEREKKRHAEIETLLAQMTPKRLVTECNRRRIALGLSPYAIAARAA